NHIEIEKKYTVPDDTVFNRVLDVIKRWDQYEVEDSQPAIKQVDFYFDTKDNLLFKNDVTLRIREKDSRKILTIKTPTSESNDRFEYEKELNEKRLIEHKDFITRYIPKLSDDDIEKLEKKIKISNNRQEVILQKEKVEFEMVFDDVKYYRHDNGKCYNEFQIEVELKSDYPHRINLNKLGNYLEENIEELKIINDPKYKRALRFTQR
ncbi:MAG: CYTH domain-containing protein, partial [bacterium]